MWDKIKVLIKSFGTEKNSLDAIWKLVYQVFLQILKTALKKYRCVLHAYCLMTNHIHLLLETCDMEIYAGLTSVILYEHCPVGDVQDCCKFCRRCGGIPYSGKIRKSTGCREI